jgi:hypothetical protein
MASNKGNKNAYKNGEATQFTSENQPKNNGRKPKSFRMFNDMMKAKGFEPLTKEQLIEFYSFIFAADENTISVVAEDAEQPLALRLMIAEMTNDYSRSRAMTDFRDYMFGKAMQQIKQDIAIKEQPLFPE